MKKLKKKEARTLEEKQILERLSFLQEGYFKRDISQVENWVMELMAEDVQIIGTNSIYPEDFEWRSGHTAAIELFENDWKNWGDVKFYYDFSEIALTDNIACVSLFAIVLRDTSKEEQRTFEASKKDHFPESRI